MADTRPLYMLSLEVHLTEEEYEAVRAAASQGYGGGAVGIEEMKAHLLGAARRAIHLACYRRKRAGRAA